jgi:hypothetical protein
LKERETDLLRKPNEYLPDVKVETDRLAIHGLDTWEVMISYGQGAKKYVERSIDGGYEWWLIQVRAVGNRYRQSDIKNKIRSRICSD